MIARIWHGVTAAATSDAYLDYPDETGVPDYRATEGNRGVYVLRRDEGDRAHLLTVAFSESTERIKGFGGPGEDQILPRGREVPAGFRARDRALRCRRRAVDQENEWGGISWVEHRQRGEGGK